MDKNSSKRIYGKTILALLLVFTTFIFAFELYPAKALSESNIDITVEGGYRNTAKLGTYVPFFITVENKGESISGEIQVLISAGNSQKIIYAKQEDFPSGTRKNVTISVPVYTASRNAEIRLVSNNRVIKSEKYEFRNIIAPSKSLVGILTEQSSSPMQLSGIRLPYGFYNNRKNITITDVNLLLLSRRVANVTKETVSELATEAVNLNERNFPEEGKLIGAFDIMIISNYDTSLLNDKQLSLLGDWVEGGRILFIGLGANARKTYGGLPDRLKPFKVEGTRDIDKAGKLEELTGKSLPGIALNVVTGDPGEGRVILEEEGIPLAIAYKKGSGVIVVLTFDPSIKPIFEWEGENILWQSLINAVYDEMQAEGLTWTEPYSDYFSSEDISNVLSSLQYPASNVPDTQKPPFTFLFVTIIIYTLFAGPVLYLILKMKDKRDLSWIAIPASALLFTMIIYIVGFKTRYTTAVLNNISLINLDEEAGTARIYTVSGAFNNSRGSMTIDYAPSDVVEIAANSDYFRVMTAYGSQPDEGDNYTLLGKLTYGNENSYEIYNVNMWEPKYIYMGKNVPYEGRMISEARVNERGFSAVIKNNTGMDLKNSFIVVGSHFYNIGDINNGEEKEISFSFDDPTVQKSIEAYLNTWYNYTSSGPAQMPASEIRDIRRKRQIIGYFFDYMGNTVEYSNSGKISFFAFNGDSIGYRLEINGKLPREFNTNFVYLTTDIEFKKGEHVYLPAGIITAVPDYMQSAYYNWWYKLVDIYESGNVDLKFIIPDNISPEEIKITWEPLSGEIENVQPRMNSSDEGEDNENMIFRMYIFNNATQQWEEFDKEFIITAHESSPGINSFINNEGEIKVRVSVNIEAMEESDREMFIKWRGLNLPELQLRGVVR